jgi:hypothetical protein
MTSLIVYNKLAIYYTNSLAESILLSFLGGNKVKFGVKSKYIMNYLECTPMIDLLKATYERLINQTETKTYRYLYPSFNLHNRLTGLVGARGVGKTTLLLQYIKNNLYKDRKAFYFSADNIYFNTTSLLDFINRMFLDEGIEIFFIDEIHKYKLGDWSQELKNIYDSFPSIKIVFSGSSSLDLVQGAYDLSRRAKMFRLHGLSFREYLNFKTGSTIEPVSFDLLMKNPQHYDGEWSQIPKIMGHFKDYLHYGYYPFLFEDMMSYYEKISQIIDKTIYEDISQYYPLKTNYLYHLKKILNFLATIPPGQISVHNLANNLSIDDKTVFSYLKLLEETGLTRSVSAKVKGNQVLRKPEKLFLNNTTVLSAINSYLGHSIDKGTLRELFFIQSLEDAGINVFYSKLGDFRADKYVFEIGGKNKKQQQIKEVEMKAYLVKDDILVSAKNQIPLYYFGFLY